MVMVTIGQSAYTLLCRGDPGPRVVLGFRSVFWRISTVYETLTEPILGNSVNWSKTKSETFTITPGGVLVDTS